MAAVKFIKRDHVSQLKNGILLLKIAVKLNVRIIIFTGIYLQYCGLDAFPVQSLPFRRQGGWWLHQPLPLLLSLQILTSLLSYQPLTAITISDDVVLASGLPQ